jgi:hypothetical protein
MGVKISLYLEEAVVFASPVPEWDTDNTLSLIRYSMHASGEIVRVNSWFIFMISVICRLVDHDVVDPLWFQVFWIRYMVIHVAGHFVQWYLTPCLLIKLNEAPYIRIREVGELHSIEPKQFIVCADCSL